MATGKNYEVLEVGIFTPNEQAVDKLRPGEVGYLIANIKKTADIIPLCHPLPIDHTATKITMNESDYSLDVYCVVSAYAKTGVEMEAIMGVNTALITIYDLSKIVNPDLKIEGIKLLVKQGGKSGLWLNPNGLPKFLADLF